MIEFDDLNRVIKDAKAHGNSYFGLLGGEPFMYPHLFEVLEAHPDCYFQIFTNGQLITDEVAARLRRAGNATPLISIEGTEIVSNERRGGTAVLSKTLEGLQNCVNKRLIVGVATSVCQTNIDLVDEAWLKKLIDLGGALLLVSHVSGRRSRSSGATRAHPRAGLARTQVRRRDAGQTPHWHRRCVLG